MNKYIDAEKLKAEINERLMAMNLEKLGNFGSHRVWAYNDVKDIIGSLQQEQPKSKFVKVRCVFPFDKTWEKDKIYICEVWHHGDLNRNFFDVYYDYEKDPKYVQFPTIELLNEEFAIIQDESKVISEQPEVDLEKEIEKYYYENFVFIYSIYIPTKDILSDIAVHFYELGRNVKRRVRNENL